MPEALAYRKYNLLRIQDPKCAEIRRAIHREICVARRVTSREQGRTVYNIAHEQCFEQFTSSSGMYYVMGYGFRERLEELFARYGYELNVIDASPLQPADALRFVPDLHVLENTRWRENQVQIINDMSHHSTGQYVAATGAGKSFLIRSLCRIFPKARILITTYSQHVLQDLYDATILGGEVSAGIYCSSQREPQGRVLFCSLGCVSHFTDREWDFLILDEKHECATIKRMQPLLAVKSRRAYAMSANHGDRADQADQWLEAVFGQNRISVSHLEAVAAGDIVPVKVRWARFDTPGLLKLNPNSPHFERDAFWRNSVRNQFIADLVDEVRPSGQCLVYVKTLDHIYRLRQLLNCPVAHAPPSRDRWQELIDAGLVEPDEPLPKAADMKRVRMAFAANETPVAICNSVWKRGVNFPYLQTFIRADGGASTIDATQLSGRLTRHSPGKTHGELIDLSDEFHDSTENRARSRFRSYDKLGYQQKHWSQI